jgi:hypothetical protein
LGLFARVKGRGGSRARRTFQSLSQKCWRAGGAKKFFSDIPFFTDLPKFVSTIQFFSDIFVNLSKFIKILSDERGVKIF